MKCAGRSGGWAKMRAWGDQPEAEMAKRFHLEGQLGLAAIGCLEMWAETMKVAARLSVKRQL